MSCQYVSNRCSGMPFVSGAAGLKVNPQARPQGLSPALARKAALLNGVTRPHRLPHANFCQTRRCVKLFAAKDDVLHRAENLAEEVKSNLDPAIALSIAAVVSTGVANRVLYKMALVPMGDYVFFLAQLQTFGYVFAYFLVLYIRYRQGIVSKEMIDATDKKQFLYIGAFEAVSSLLGFVGASKLPGVALPLLQQSSLFWQLSLSSILLGKRFSGLQIGGALTVAAGVCIAAFPSKGSDILSQINPMYAGAFVLSMLFPALSSIFKERIFTEGKKKLGKPLDIFVVNSFGSASQALFVFLLLPVLTQLRSIAFSELPGYLYEGAQCFCGVSPIGAPGSCAGAPWLPVAYVATNLLFNVSILNLLRQAGNVVQSLSLSALVPLTIWAFTLPLPYLPPPPELGPQFLVGGAVLVGGLLTYNSPQWAGKGDKSK